MRAALGLDVGTTSVKAVVIAEDGRLLAEGASSALEMKSPLPGWAVQSTRGLRSAVIECLGATARALAPEVTVTSLTCAVQSGSVATIDKSDMVATDLTTWMDTRSHEFVKQWRSDGTGDLIRRTSGWSVDPGQGLPQLAWIRAHDRATWAALGRICSADDLVTHWLTDAWMTNPSNAAGMALLDINAGRWSQQLCDLIALRDSTLSELRGSGTTIGSLTREMAAATGLPEDLAVVNGGHDQACAALALGVTEPADALLAGGTAWVVSTVVPLAAMPAVPAEMNVSYHVVPDLRTASTYVGGMGTSMEWLLSTVAPSPEGTDRFAALDARVADTRITKSSPYFRATGHANGMPCPGAGEFVGPSPAPSIADRALAIMEYAAFELRTSLQSLPHSHRPRDLTVVGGVTRSPGWTQLIADICEVTVVEADAGSLPALGAASLGAVSSGLIPDLRTAVESFNIQRTTIHPDPHHADLFRRRYERHLDQEHPI